MMSWNFFKKRPAPVAIILRTKNGGLFLPRAIRSILAQTQRDWRLVVVNEGQDPNILTGQILPYREKLGSRLVLLQAPAGISPGAALNLGIQGSRSEFIAVHDEQDTWEPEFLATCLATLRQNDEDACVTQVRLVREKLDGGAIVEVSREIYNEWQNRSVSLFRLAESNTLANIGLVFRRRALQEIGNRREDLGALEDWEFNLRLAARFGITLIPAVLANMHLGLERKSLDDLSKLDTEIRNELLRKDIASGRLGLGLISCMGNLHGQMYQKIHALQQDIRELSNGSH